MELPMILESTLISFVIQLLLCFKAKRHNQKWLPLIIVLAADAASWIIYLTAGRPDALTLPFLLAVLCLLWLAGIGAAWAVYGIVKAVQKRK